MLDGLCVWGDAWGRGGVEDRAVLGYVSIMAVRPPPPNMRHIHTRPGGECVHASASLDPLRVHTRQAGERGRGGGGGGIRERETERQRQRDRDRDRERERQRDRESERERQRETERERGAHLTRSMSMPVAFHTSTRYLPTT